MITNKWVDSKECRFDNRNGVSISAITQTTTSYGHNLILFELFPPSHPCPFHLRFQLTKARFHISISYKRAWKGLSRILCYFMCLGFQCSSSNWGVNFRVNSEAFAGVRIIQSPGQSWRNGYKFFCPVGATCTIFKVLQHWPNKTIDKGEKQRR